MKERQDTAPSATDIPRILGGQAEKTSDAPVSPLPDERLDEVNDRLSLLQKKKGMTFGTDALLLAAFVHARPESRGLELGAGSGIVSLLCAARGKFAHIECVEIQHEYADLCRRNVRLNGLGDIIEVTEADLRCEKDYAPKEVDAVFANPPYMTCDSGFAASDPGRHAARHEVWGGLADFCRAAAHKVRYGGAFFTVWRPDRMTDLLCHLRAAGLEPKRMVFVFPAEGAAPSLLLTEARRGGAPGGLVTRPFYMADKSGNTTPEMTAILTGGRMPL